jgi:hypothetical protein
LQGAAAASNLADLFGGIEGFQQATSAYYENFYTDAEQFNIASRQLAESLESLGLAMPLDRLEFRAQVERALAESNDELFASLIKLAPAFAELTKSTDELAAAAANAAKAASEAAKQAAQEAFNATKAATDSAFSALQRAVSAESDAAKKALTETYNALVSTLTLQKDAALAAQEVAQSNVSTLKGLFTLLKNQIESLVNAAGAGMTATQGRAFIEQAIATARTTGYLPEQETLAKAISAAVTGTESGNYATAFEQRRDRLILASSLGDLEDLTKDQLTVAERQLAATLDQVKLLDSQLKNARTNFDDLIAANDKYYAQVLADAKTQIDLARGLDVSIKSVKDAVVDVANAIRNELAAAFKNQNAGQNYVNNLVREAAAQAGGTISYADALRAGTNLGISKAEIDAAVNATGVITGGGQSYVNDLVKEAATQAGGTISYADALRAGTALGITKEEIEAAARATGVITRAGGGYTPPGLVLVGEDGPELVNFRSPGMVYTADQTGTMMGSSVALVDEVRALREDNQAQARAMVQIQARFTKLLERWDSDGIPEQRAVA